MLDLLLGLLAADFKARASPAREAEFGRHPATLVRPLAAAAYRVYYANPIVGERVLVLAPIWQR